MRYENSAEPPWNQWPIMPFGRHKGRIVADLPLHYLQWMVQKCDYLDEQLKAHVLRVIAVGRLRGGCLQLIRQDRPEGVASVHDLLAGVVDAILFASPLSGLLVIGCCMPSEVESYAAWLRKDRSAQAWLEAGGRISLWTISDTVNSDGCTKLMRYEVREASAPPATDDQSCPAPPEAL